MSLQLNIKLSSQEQDKLMRLLSVYNKKLESIIEESLKRFLSIACQELEDICYCPKCYVCLGHKKVILKGMPILEADKKGIYPVGDELREYAKEYEIYYVVCLECLYESIWDKISLSKSLFRLDGPLSKD
ncbi:MAG: hypothetical protein A2167_01810 [Planctomycetes bacterium RBG_13_46_10]|nr:MAG: hypothetical protein A2167_01810 [Planctomycetes bacterium RBG_13_46_10]QBM02884.1 hypothetical protein [uncultured archaeon]